MISRPGLFFAMLVSMAVALPAQADKLDDIIAGTHDTMIHQRATAAKRMPGTRVSMPKRARPWM